MKMNFYEKEFLAEKLLTQGFPDLNCSEISVGKKLFLEIVRKDVVVVREDGEVTIPICPVRIVVDDSGRSSFQVWFREIMHATTNDHFIELLKKLTRLGGHYLCMGVDNDLYRVNPCSKLLKESSYPCTYEAASIKCQSWFLPPSGGVKGRNSSFLARCSHCSKWMQMTRNLQRVKKRRAIQASQKSENACETENVGQLLLEQQVDDGVTVLNFCDSDLNRCSGSITEMLVDERHWTGSPSPQCKDNSNTLDGAAAFIEKRKSNEQQSSVAAKCQRLTEVENIARHGKIDLLSNLCEAIIDECSKESPSSG